MSSRCKSCQAEMTWATNAATGRPRPLDAIACPPDAPGAVLFVVRDDSGKRWCYGLKALAEKLAEKEQVSYDRAVELVKTRYPAHRPHHATCPNVDQHRRTP